MSIEDEIKKLTDAFNAFAKKFDMEAHFVNLPKTNTEVYFTVKQIPQYYPCFNVNGLRSIIFNEKNNGFSRCIKRVGRKILINKLEFEKWVNNK